MNGGREFRASGRAPRAAVGRAVDDDDVQAGLHPRKHIDGSFDRIGAADDGQQRSASSIASRSFSGVHPMRGADSPKTAVNTRSGCLTMNAPVTAPPIE